MFVVWWFDGNSDRWQYRSFGKDFDTAWDLFSTLVKAGEAAIFDHDSASVLYSDRAKEVMAQ